MAADKSPRSREGQERNQGDLVPDSAAPGQLSPRWKVPGLWSWLSPGGLSSGPPLSGVGLPRAQPSLSRVLCLIIQTLSFFRKVP